MNAPATDFVSLLAGLPADDRAQMLDAIDQKMDADIERADRQLAARTTWGNPLPLRPDRRTLPGFPSDALPGWLRDYVRAEAEATQTPLDLAGMLALAAVATCCAGRIEAQPWSGWIEPLNLYVAVVLPPAARKSAVVRDLVRPIEQHERDLAGKLAQKVAESASKRRVLEQRIKTLESKASKATGEQLHDLEEQIKQAQHELDATPEVVLPRLTCDDCTPESLLNVMAQHEGRIAVLSPEGGCFDAMTGVYRQRGGPPLEVWLKAHAGDSIRVDRVTRPAVYVGRPALTIGVAIQPDVLETIGRDRAFAGRGLLARFLWSVPNDGIGTRKPRPSPVPAALEQAYGDGLVRLLRVGWATGPDGERAPHMLHFEPEAQAAVERLLAGIEPMLAPEGELYEVQAWAGKLGGAVVRIAGLLHLAAGRDPAAAVTEQTVQEAGRIGAYLVEAALLAWSEMRSSGAAAAAEHVLRVLARWGVSEFSARDLWLRIKGCKSLFEKRSDLDAPLALLVEKDWIRPTVDPTEEDDRGPGRPASTSYQLNPLGEIS